MSDVSDPGQGSEQEQARADWGTAAPSETGAAGQAAAPAPGQGGGGWQGTPGQGAGGWQGAPGPADAAGAENAGGPESIGGPENTGGPESTGGPAGSGYPGYQGYGPTGYGPDQGASQPGWYYRPNRAWDPDPGTYWGPPTHQWPWGPPPDPPGLNRRDRRRHRKLTGAVAGAAVAVGVLAGVGIGHLTWAGNSVTPTAASTPAGSGSSSSGSTGSGSTGSGSSGGGFSGLNPSGSGNSGSSGSGFGGSGFGGSGFGGSGFGGSGSGSSGSSGSGSGSISSSPGSPSDVSAIDKKVTPGLVDINLQLGYQDEEAAGTGMVLTSNGEILTNNHVIDGATSISVTDLANSKTYTAKVVGYDPSVDVAVLQLNGASGLQTVSIGDSSKASIGEAVVGIGNAGGAGGTPSAAGGAITALNQSITASDPGDGSNEQLTGLIGDNAQIEEGDSGGPLVTSSGQVIGMDVAGSSSTSSAFSAVSGTTSSATQTIGYAIPINEAMSIAHQITSGQGSSTVHIGATGFLGISVESPGQSGGSGGFGGYFGGGGYGSLGSGSSGSGSSGATSGAEIVNVVNGSAAAQAGLQDGDVITGLDGQTVSTPSDLSKLLLSHHPGDKVQVAYTDASGQSETASVTLGSGPPA